MVFINTDRFTWDPKSSTFSCELSDLPESISEKITLVNQKTGNKTEFSYYGEDSLGLHFTAMRNDKELHMLITHTKSK